jgi:hypothetical protein
VRKDLRDTAINAAAARYGSKYYRRLLFMDSVRRYWPVIPALLAVAGIGWMIYSNPETSGVASVVVIALLVSGFLLVRWLRSPYRRRRF